VVPGQVAAVGRSALYETNQLAQLVVDVADAAGQFA
jgi:hypothetical protein